MLRNLVGDEQWWAGIQNYYRRYMNSHATTAEFRAEMEAVCGCDLQQFFDQWLYQGGNIVLEGTWRYDEASGSVDVALRQVQRDGFEFSTTVDIGVYEHAGSLPTIHRLALGPDGGRLTIPVSGRPARVVIDPKTVLLARWTFKEVSE